MTGFAGGDPATQAAADVERLMSEAAGLQRIVDLAGEVGEGERPGPDPRRSPGRAPEGTSAEPGAPG